MTDREALQCKIVRDADKIDILYAFSTNRLLEVIEDDAEISKEVEEEFYKHKQTKNVNIKSKNDRIISMISLVFDLNFDYSKERVLNENYLKKLYSHFTNKERFKPYIQEAIKYLKGGNKNVR